jgi:YD repeat-containing protein
LTRPNGVNTNYTYDGLSHLLSVLHQTGSATLDGSSYGYDYAGNRTSNTNYLNGITSNYGRVARALNCRARSSNCGAPSLRFLQGRVPRTYAAMVLTLVGAYATRPRNEISVQPTLTRTGPASPRR